MGHARCLIGRDDAQELADKIVEHDFNVRQTEKLVKDKQLLHHHHNATETDSNKVSKKKRDSLDRELATLSESLSKKFGIKVIIENSLKKGKIILYYENFDELDHILSTLN